MKEPFIAELQDIAQELQDRRNFFYNAVQDLYFHGLTTDKIFLEYSMECDVADVLHKYWLMGKGTPL